MTEVQVGSVKVDVCQGGCGGIWFDAFELQRVDEEHEAAGDQLLDIQCDETITVDYSRKRTCPRCLDVKLKRHFSSARREVEVDECPNCGGYWLDAGELARIRLEKGQAGKAEKLRQNAIPGDVIRYLYRMRTRDE